MNVRSKWWAVALLAACGTERSAGPAEGIHAPLGEAMPRASAEALLAFQRGKEVALRRFAPADGLGPTFNVVACASCHEKPVLGGGAGRYRDFLLEGSVGADGALVPLGKNGVQNQYALSVPTRVPTPDGVNHTATRNPIPFFGVGLLAEIDEREILRHADPDDRNHDGISGRPNYDRGFVGRLGVKAQTVSVEKFIRGPLFNHLGITTDPLSDAQKALLPVNSAGARAGQAAREAALTRLFLSVAHAQVAAPDEPTRDMDGVPDPELAPADLFDLVSFAMLLAPPPPDAPTPATERGRASFDDLGCATCHVPSLDGPRGAIPAFSDLLLHDMGEALADGVTMGVAKGSEFRTAPLWGVAAAAPYLHDGRADTLREAILAHGGEAAPARDAFAALDTRAAEELVAFLSSLGGKEVASPGLLAPDAPIEAPGSYGAPLAAASPDERAQFARGRALFDGDRALSGGLGPAFNGDSCRACHFQPALGGAGPRDVDVLRQGLVDDRGEFARPRTGTLLHLHAVDGARNEPDPDATLFERRQTPPLFGLGLIARIADATLLALADPDDRDGDGVRGRAHVLPDGKLGRFGWKANVPSLADFARDALSNELGLTVPEDADSAFGASKDGDHAPDPELGADQVADLAAFMGLLAAPPRSPGDDPASEARGEAQFRALGCAACHVPSLPSADGTDVPLYSDLLLHDVAADGYVGIGEGSAQPRTLRTPPLWGLAKSGPYMHDGSADGPEDAVALHAGEAEASRRAYEALDAAARRDLVRFLASL